MDLFDIAVASKLAGGGGGGGGGSNITLLGSDYWAVNPTSTSAQYVGFIDCGTDVWTDNAIIWVHIRDKAGPRKGYHYGTDSFFINTRKANGTATNCEDYGILALRVNSDGTFGSYNRKTGVFASYIQSDNRVNIQAQYSSSNSLTINGIYQVDVYKIPLPDGVKLFEAVPQ